MIKYKILIVTFFIALINNTIILATEPITPIPQTILYDTLKAKIGKKLFFDTGLSLDNTVACVSCHTIENGAEHRKTSIGIKGQKGYINAPTVFNSIFNFRQMYSGSAKDLAQQANSPINNPIEMGSNPKHVVSYVKSISWYREMFYKAYGDKSIKYSHITDAIEEFEKTLITPNSKFDRYLRGEENLTQEELEGYKLFKTLGCITCHNGINIGGNSYQKLGLIYPYPWKKYFPDRYSITHNPFDKNIYKVPTLRNIAITAPYFHDGSASTLEDALKKMAYYNLGFELNKNEIKGLKAFLMTLTGEKPKSLEESF